MPVDPQGLFEQCRQLLGVTQVELGKQLGVSRRTAQRWTDRGVPSYEMIPLARLVYAQNPAFAAEIVASAGSTLEAEGLRAPAAPPSSLSVPDAVVDAVVCAASEAMDLMPREVRPGLYAAFARAKEIGLTVEVIERALRPSPGAAAEPARPKARATRG